MINFEFNTYKDKQLYFLNLLINNLINLKLILINIFINIFQ